MHLPHRVGRDGPMHDWNADVFDPGRPHDLRLGEGPRLHRIAIVEYHFTTCRLEILQLLLGWLTARYPARDGLGCIGQGMKRVEAHGHYGSPPPVNPGRFSTPMR